MGDRSLNTKKFLPQVRKRAWEQHHGIYRPRHAGDRKTTWPVCMTCGRDVDSVNVEDIGTDTVTVRATCHGQEAIIKMQFPFKVVKRSDDHTWQHVMEAVHNSTFFDPTIS